MTYRSERCDCPEHEVDAQVEMLAAALVQYGMLVGARIGACDRTMCVALAVAGARLGLLVTDRSPGEVKEQVNEAARMARRWVDEATVARGAPVNDNRGE